MDNIRISAVEKAVNDCTIGTFRSMLSMDVTPVAPAAARGFEGPPLAGVIHFVGPMDGALTLHVSTDLAVVIATAMLGTDEGGIGGEEEIKDVLGELVHLISRGLGTCLLKDDRDFTVCAPSIIQGTDFKLAFDDLSWFHRWIFRHKQHEMVLEISLREKTAGRTPIDGKARLEGMQPAARIDSIDLAALVTGSVADVFATLLSMNLAPSGTGQDIASGSRTTAMISFAGDVQGFLAIQVEDRFGRSMAASMLGISEDDVDGEEEVCDVLRELSRIVGGQLVETFARMGLACVLPSPMIALGQDYQLEPLGFLQIRRFLFSCGDAVIAVDAGIRAEGSEETGTTQPIAEDPGAGEDGRGPDDDLRNLNMIMEIPMELTVQMGSARMRIAELLKLDTESIVELEQLEGEPVDLLVNETLIAKGEVVVEKEKYGIRIVEIVSRKERVKSFR